MNGFGLDNILWFASAAGQIALLWVMLRKSFYRQFPLFTSYIALSIVTDFILLFRQNTPSGYFVTYYALKIPEALLELGVLMEIASNVVRPVRRSLPAGMLWLLCGLILVGSAAGIALALYAQPHTLSLLASSFFRVTFGIAVLRLLIFAAIAGFAQLLGIGWKNYVLQLATGLAFYGAVSIGVELYFIRFGITEEYKLLSQLRNASYVFTLGYWIFSFVRQEAPRKNFSPQMEKLLVSLSGTARTTREALRSSGGRQ